MIHREKNWQADIKQKQPCMKPVSYTHLDVYKRQRQILVDKETGVNYLCWKSGYGAGITPLLDSEGKVIITK